MTKDLIDQRPKQYLGTLSEADVRLELLAECSAAGSAAAWARQKGVNDCYVRSVLRGVVPVGPSICMALGLVKEPPRWRWRDEG